MPRQVAVLTILMSLSIAAEAAPPAAGADALARLSRTETDTLMQECVRSSDPAASDALARFSNRASIYQKRRFLAGRLPLPFRAQLPDDETPGRPFNPGGNICLLADVSRPKPPVGGDSCKARICRKTTVHCPKGADLFNDCTIEVGDCDYSNC